MTSSVRWSIVSLVLCSFAQAACKSEEKGSEEGATPSTTSAAAAETAAPASNTDAPARTAAGAAPARAPAPAHTTTPTTSAGAGAPSAVATTTVTDGDKKVSVGATPGQLPSVDLKNQEGKGSIKPTSSGTTITGKSGKSITIPPVG